MRVYFVLCNGRVKVGTAKNVAKRVASLQIGNPTELYLYGHIAGDRSAEKRIQAEMRKHHIRGEWFAWNITTKRIVDFELADDVRRKSGGMAGETYNMHDYRDVERLNKTRLFSGF